MALILIDKNKMSRESRYSGRFYGWYWYSYWYSYVVLPYHTFEIGFVCRYEYGYGDLCGGEISIIVVLRIVGSETR